MRLFLLASALVLVAGCDTTRSDPPPAASPTAFQVRVVSPGGETSIQRFTRDETDVEIRVLGAECGGASEYIVTGQDQQGQEARFTFSLPGDGTIPDVGTRSFSLNDGIAAGLEYDGTLGGRSRSFDADIDRSIVAINRTIPPTISGAIQIFGAAEGFDLDATVSFDEIPELGCDGR